MLALEAVGASAGASYQYYNRQWQYAPTLTCDAGGPSGPCGPSEWIQVPGSVDCGFVGTQSPIDLAVDASLNNDFEESLSLKFVQNGSCCSGKFILNEHTCEVSVEDTCSSTSYVQRHDGKIFHFTRVNFRSPSEHTWNGKYFPLEVHLVHKADDGQSLVVAVLFAMGTPTDEDMDRVGFLEKVLGMIPTAPDVGTNSDGSTVENPNYVEEDRDYENFDVYGNLVSDREFLYHYTGSFTTPPCTTNTEWYFFTEAMVANQYLVDVYRNTIQTAGPDNKLAPWGVITGSQDPDARPPFDESAGVITWNSSLGCNNRPIQPLVGASNLNREVRRTGMEVHGQLDSCPGEEGGISTWMLVLLTAGLCCFILGSVAGCIMAFQYCKPKAKKSGRSLKKTKREVETVVEAKPPSAPGSITSETAPLMAVTPASSFGYPQVVYAAPPVQAVQVVPTPVAYAPVSQVVQYQAVPAEMQQVLVQVPAGQTRPGI